MIAFLDALRAVVPASPPSAGEAALVERLSAAALEADLRVAAAPTQPMRPASAARKPAWRGRLALAAKVAVAMALVPAVMAGLAFAGVTLPEPAREAMQRIGLDLPNQSAVDEESTVSGEEADGNDRAASDRSRADGGSSASGGGASGRPAKGSSSRREYGDRGRNPSGDGEPGRDSSGQGTPQLGEPAPIAPPGQGGTPPGQGGTSPSQATPQSATPRETGPPGGAPPGQARK